MLCSISLKTWWIDMDKKTIGMIAAAVLAALSGGAEVLSLGERVEALESLHPELVTGVPMDAHEPGKTEGPAEEPAPADEPEGTDPAPGAEHLELDESGAWVEGEAPTAEEPAEAAAAEE